MGVPQSQVLSQVSGPRSFPRGYPNPGQRVPQDRVPSDQARTEVPSPPPPGTGVLPARTGPRQNSRVSTCYVVGGMPLVVTQEHFLVFKIFFMQDAMNCKYKILFRVNLPFFKLQFYGYLSQQQNMMQDYIRTSTYQRAMLDNCSDFQDKAGFTVIISVHEQV